MKKIIAILTLILMFTGAVAAQSYGSEAVDLKEINSFYNEYGAELRFTQLSESIARSITQGEIIIDNILEKDSEAEVSRLYEILDELKEIKESLGDIDYSAESDSLAETYLQMKTEATALISEFRSISQEILGYAEREELKLQFKEMNKTTSRVRNLVNQYNAEQAKRYMYIIGVSDTLSDEIRSGMMSKNQILNRIMTSFNGLDTEKQTQAILKIQEQKAINGIESSKVMENFQLKKQMNDGDSDAGHGITNGQNSGSDSGTSGGNNGGSSSSGGSNGGSSSSGGSNGGTSGGSSGGSGGGNGGKG